MSDNSITQKQKYDKVLKTLKKEYDECFEEHRETLKKINFLDNKISEIYKVIALSEKDVDPNFSLFSPVVTASGRLNENLYEEVHSMENELQQIKFQEKRLLDRLSGISDNIQCIEYAMDKLSKDLDESEKISVSVEDMDVSSNDNENAQKNNDDENNIKNNCNNHIDTNYNSNNNSDDNSVSSDENSSTENMEFVLLEFQENERSRIAMELHDSVVQNLTSLIHKTELCTKLVDKDTIRTKLELQTMIGTLKNSINEIRSIIYNLKPMALDDLGLKVTLERYIKQLSMYSDFDVILNIEEDFEEDLYPLLSVNILRIIQEACSNSIKHSNGNKIYVSLKKEDNNFLISITDNGDGFKLDSDNKIIVENDSFGLSIMRERTRLLSGSIEYYNSETNSATVKAQFPVKSN